MIEIRQAQDDLPENRLLDPFGHTSGLLSRRHAQHSMRLSSRARTMRLDERTGDFIANRDPAIVPEGITGVNLV